MLADQFMPRFWEIDFVRGVAILMMVQFHFMWDLNYFGFIEVSLYTGFWGVFQKATAGLFLALVGVTFALKHGLGRETDVFVAVKSGALIFSGGMLLTLFTFILYREQFIYFGILHLIGVSRVLAIPFAKWKYLNLIIAAAVIALPATIPLQYIQVSALVWLGLAVPSPTLDFFPVLPWFGAVLIGIFVGNTFYKGGRPTMLNLGYEPRVVRFVGLLGKNSLAIYFLHQLVLFPLVLAASAVL